MAKSSEDKFLAQHMRMEYKKKPRMSSEQKKQALAIGYNKYKKRKK